MQLKLLINEERLSTKCWGWLDYSCFNATLCNLRYGTSNLEFAIYHPNDFIVVLCKVLFCLSFFLGLIFRVGQSHRHQMSQLVMAGKILSQRKHYLLRITNEQQRDFCLYINQKLLSFLLTSQGAKRERENTPTHWVWKHSDIC